MKKTPWYPGTVKPVRVGWYEIKLNPPRRGVDRDYWNGSDWCWNYGKAIIPFLPHEQDTHQWRGLTEEQK